MQGQNGKSRKNKLKSENSTFSNSIKLVPEHVASFLPRMQGDSSTWLTEHLDGGTFLMDV